jgi:hypothetical protein
MTQIRRKSPAQGEFWEVAQERRKIRLLAYANANAKESDRWKIKLLYTYAGNYCPRLGDWQALRIICCLPHRLRLLAWKGHGRILPPMHLGQPDGIDQNKKAGMGFPHSM